AVTFCRKEGGDNAAVTFCRKEGGDNAAPKRCFRGPIDGACLEMGIHSEFTSEKGSLFGLRSKRGRRKPLE
ncbi:MAG TPA: hypothetical protein PKK79_02660, partial [Syntrophorhabdaceae bacterium]|nr:hypothetical protein [Syntrophorhabdaceae bacterium]